MYRICLLFAVLLSCLVSSVSAAQALPAFNSPGQSIVLKPGQSTLTLTLKSNPTTGYSWFYQGGHAKLLKVASQRYVAPAASSGKKMMTGVPGYEIWTFKVNNDTANVPRIITIKMRYARPWDVKDSKPVRFYAVLRRA